MKVSVTTDDGEVVEVYHLPLLQLGMPDARTLALRQAAELSDLGTNQGDIRVDITVDNNYADGYAETRRLTVEVGHPDQYANRDEWASECLLEFTGTDSGRDNVDALYTVTITGSEHAPDLIGYTYEAMG